MARVWRKSRLLVKTIRGKREMPTQVRETQLAFHQRALKTLSVIATCMSNEDRSAA